MIEPLWTDQMSAWSALAAAILSAAAFIGVFLVLGQIRMQRMQLHRELENFYVARYWQILDALDEVGLSPEVKETRSRLVGAYLRLSEDECDLRAADRVTDETWEFWRDGMLQVLADPSFRSELDAAPEGRFIQLQQLMKQKHQFDPTNSTFCARKRKGLAEGFAFSASPTAWARSHNKSQYGRLD